MNYQNLTEEEEIFNILITMNKIENIFQNLLSPDGSIGINVGPVKKKSDKFYTTPEHSKRWKFLKWCKLGKCWYLKHGFKIECHKIEGKYHLLM